MLPAKRPSIAPSASGFVATALSHVLKDASQRTRKLFGSALHSILGGILFLPTAAGQAAVSGAGYVDFELNPDKPQYEPFKAGQANVSNLDGQKALADVDNFLATDGIEWYSWTRRVAEIRQSGDPRFCVGNLSIALNGLGPAYQAGSSGATTLLTLLPTAGALIGTPTKELWVLYKLMPLAGILSMVLSLGGNIVPSDINDYESIAEDPLNFESMIASTPTEKRSGEDNGPAVDPLKDIPAEEKKYHQFAQTVAARARDPTGTRKTAVIAFGIFSQLSWIACILFACWFMQSGTIIVWWCNFKPFMWSWYGFVGLSSIIDSIAGVPFTKQWTIRVSRAAKVEISPHAPWVIPEPEHELKDLNTPHNSNIPSIYGKTPAFDADEINVAGEQHLPSNISASSVGGFYQPRHYSALSQHSNQPFVAKTSILDGLEKGYNTFGGVSMPEQAWSAANNAFYVIISVRGVSNPHAALRVFSKLLSIGVYTVGTAMFASSTLATILVAVVVASMVIVAGVFGRVTAMWMTSELMKDQPMLNAIAKNRSEAEQYIEAMLRQKDMVFEVLGHIIIDGRCIKRLPALRWSKILGVLAPPFDITRLSANRNFSRV